MLNDLRTLTRRELARLALATVVIVPLLWLVYVLAWALWGGPQ